MIAMDICDQPEKSEVIVFDITRNLVLYQNITDRVIEIGTFNCSDEDGQYE